MNIYFSGIGGVGIGPLAEIAADAGYTVQGSDVSEGLLTRELQKRGIALSFSQDGSFLRQRHELQPIDWFVYTAALPNDHPELVLARQLGIRTAKRDELLAHIIADKQLKLLAVAGTHGKTTTSGMLVWTLQQLDIPVSYSVGTTLSFGPSGKFDPASEYFVYECDEFDRNFLHFHPYLSLITAVDYDHPDTYPTEADYKAAFGQFIQQSDNTLLWQQDADYLRLHEARMHILQPSDTLSLKLAGEHNRRNGTLVVKAIEQLQSDDAADNSFSETSAARGERGAGALGEARREAVSEKDVSDSIIKTALESFPGTDRRFEKLTDKLYTDYGHHPTEIAATLQMARELSDHVVLVYQPHQNIRQHEIRDQYTDAVFHDATEIYWLPTYLSREDPNLPILTPRELSSRLDQEKLFVADFNDNLWDAIQRHLDAGHLVLCMGAGAIDGWVRNKL